MRYVNPLVEGSSPSPVTRAETPKDPANHAKSPAFQAVSVKRSSERLDSPSRHQAHQNELVRRPDTDQNTDRDATTVHPVYEVARSAFPADLRFIVDAWTDLPEAIKAGVLAMVRVTLNRGDGE
jgi:hypothetical protein